MGKSLGGVLCAGNCDCCAMLYQVFLVLCMHISLLSSGYYYTYRVLGIATLGHRYIRHTVEYVLSAQA